MWWQKEKRCRKCGDKYIAIAGHVPWFYCPLCIGESIDRVERIKTKCVIKPLPISKIYTLKG